MKKLLTLLALLTCFIGAKAEWVEDYKIDYSQNTGFPFYVMGYVPEWVDGVMTDLGANYKYVTVEGASETSDVIVKTQGGTEYYQIALTSPGWHQYFIADGIPTELDGNYKVTAMVRASEACTFNVNMGWGWGEGEQIGAAISVPTEWTEVEWEYSGIGGTSCNLVAQPGGLTAKIEWKYVVVAHNNEVEKPIEWVEALENGDAEKSWESIGLADVKWYDQENNFKVCAWSKEKGNNDSQPKPCDIEEEADGNHVFVVHAQPATTEGDASAWDNQFWIQSPKAWKSGTQLKIHFRYKASQPVSSTDTQIHKQNPSDYLIWHAIGNIAFTTEWKEFDNIMTISDDMANGWSIAFNLNSVVKDAVDFYFDDLSWQYMDLDEGFFVAGANPSEGLDYDLDNATQFVYDEAQGFWTATVGEKDTPVSQVMISTVRGNDAAFKGATLKPSGTVANDPDTWLEYTESSLAKVNLPGAGVWKISLNDANKTMAFQMLDGDIKEPIEINPNPTVVVVNAVERDILVDEGGTGQPWDNQFWIVANRTLSAGETTVVKFKYKSSIPAKVTTQCHTTPGNYLHWDALGEFNFTEEWQEFETKYTVPNDANEMQSIAFNMAEIKQACKYEIKDVVWKLDDDTESLINQTGTENFYVKVLGEGPHVFVLSASELLGDANEDGKVDVTDVMTIVNNILNLPNPAFNGTNADFDKNGEIDVTDVMMVVNYILGKPTQTTEE